MDGPSFLEVVSSYLRIQSLPVVVLTGLAESPMIDRTQARKVNAVLAKGKATSEDILKAIEEALMRLPGSAETLLVHVAIYWPAVRGSSRSRQ